MSAQKIKDFYDLLVATGVVAGDVDWRASFSTEYVGKGVGLELKK
jgi:NitT/TauT family transport system substrate-binding protein